MAQTLTRAPAAAAAAPGNRPQAAQTRLRRYAPGAVVYLFATLLTGAYFPGDGPYYVGAVLRARATGDFLYWDAGSVSSFWEFGHLLWRPLGWLLHRAASPLLPGLFFGGDERAEVAFVFHAINWIAGLACVLLLRDLVAPRRVEEGELRANLLVAGFVFTLGFLNYAQTACSYVPGLAFLMLALRLLLTETDRRRGLSQRKMALWGGAALALAVGMWFLYAFVVPAVLIAPLALAGRDGKREWRRVITSALACGVLVAAMYAATIAALGLHSPGEVLAWVRAASHGIVHNKGVPQVVFGLARSFIGMGNDGVLFKRYLLSDPYNPVSLLQLVRLSVWKLALFYLFAGAFAFVLLRRGGGARRLLLLCVAGLPVFTFALLWHGTTMERYMPLYPFIFIACAWALSAEAPASRWFKRLAFIFGVALTASNFWMSSIFVLADDRDAQLARVEELRPRLKAGSALFVGQDPLAEQVMHSASSGDERLRGLPVYSFLSLNVPETGEWQHDFSAKALEVWRAGGEAWVSRRLLAERPQADWNWVEGADPRLRWVDLPAFFKRLETGEILGGDDGFVLLPRTPRNEEFLRKAAAEDAAARS